MTEKKLSKRRGYMADTPAAPDAKVITGRKPLPPMVTRTLLDVEGEANLQRARADELEQQVAALEATIAENKLKGNDTDEAETAIKAIKDGNFAFLDPNEIIITEYADRGEEFLHSSKFFDLVESIQNSSTGISVPITVRRNGDDLELVAGRRRLEACIIQSIKVPAVIRELTDRELIEVQQNENNFRHDISPFARAMHFQKLLDKGICSDQVEIAEYSSRTKASVNQYLSLLAIPFELRTPILGETSTGTRSVNGIDVDTFDTVWAPTRSMVSVAQAFRNATPDNIQALREIVEQDAFKALTLKKRVSTALSALKPIAVAKKKNRAAKTLADYVQGESKLGSMKLSANGTLQVTVVPAKASEELIAKIRDLLDTEFNN